MPAMSRQSEFAKTAPWRKYSSANMFVRMETTSRYPCHGVNSSFFTYNKYHRLRNAIRAAVPTKDNASAGRGVDTSAIQSIHRRVRVVPVGVVVLGETSLEYLSTTQRSSATSARASPKQHDLSQRVVAAILNWNVFMYVR